jgi:hypothetical protein
MTSHLLVETHPMAMVRDLVGRFNGAYVWLVRQFKVPIAARTRKMHQRSA